MAIRVYVLCLAVLFTGTFVLPASAGIVITPETNAANLGAALSAGSGITINSITLSGHTLGSGAASSGIYNATGSSAYGLTGSGIVLSTGDVRDYADPNPNGGGTNRSTNYATGFAGYSPPFAMGVPATGAQNTLLTPISGMNNKYDVTQVDINFTLAPNRNAVAFDVVFGSEEFPEFVNAGFNDGFGLFVNGNNIAFASNGSSGLDPISIDHPLMQALLGTELDGVLAPLTNPIMSFAEVTGFGSTGTLTFIVADVGDGVFDTTVFFRGLSGATIPEPQSWSIAIVACASGLMGFVRLRKRIARPVQA